MSWWGRRGFFELNLISSRTVWSAPNYCYRCGNIASIYNVDEGGSTSFTLFEAAAQEKRAPIPADFNVGKYFL